MTNVRDMTSPNDLYEIINATPPQFDQFEMILVILSYSSESSENLIRKVTKMESVFRSSKGSLEKDGDPSADKQHSREIADVVDDMTFAGYVKLIEKQDAIHAQITDKGEHYFEKFLKKRVNQWSANVKIRIARYARQHHRHLGQFAFKNSLTTQNMIERLSEIRNRSNSEDSLGLASVR